MNRLEIIQMAQEAAAKPGHEIRETNEIVETLTSFAELVTAKERAECASYLESTNTSVISDDPILQNWSKLLLSMYFVEALRARGNT
jgi:hypothetical protein